MGSTRVQNIEINYYVPCYAKKMNSFKFGTLFQVKKELFPLNDLEYLVQCQEAVTDNRPTSGFCNILSERRFCYS